MIQLASCDNLHSNSKPVSLWLDQNKNIIIFKRDDLIFVFNMHPTNSYEDVFINCDMLGAGRYKVVFSSDDENYGGWNRISKDTIYSAGKDDYGFGFRLYMPCRTAAVLKKHNKK